MFTPTHTEALARLSAFLPKAGRHYAEMRNYDDTGHVSTLSPYLRHRMISETEVLTATLARHSPQAASKFVAEVFWRTYWKGWLELRPQVWDSYKATLQADLNRVQSESGLRQQWEAACKGETGIACFDHWARQLADTGYLHNHARMWFASIWIFTLRLPWSLGADFFMRHLLDGDAASNTLSWRWVGGLQTVGKTYLALPDNIAKYTNGRFRPTGLASFAAPLEPDGPTPKAGPVPQIVPFDPQKPCGLLLTEDDLSPGWLLDKMTPVATATLQTTDARSPLQVAGQVTDFVRDAIEDCTRRHADRLGAVTTLADADQIAGWAAENGVAQVVTSYPPVGPAADRLRAAGVTLHHQIRPYDSRAWPHATHGFFRFKEKIPRLLEGVQQDGPALQGSLF